jgi:hypothetical protein
MRPAASAALLALLLAALLTVSGSALAKKPPSPRTQARQAFTVLLVDTRITPKAVVAKRHRKKLVRIAKLAQKQWKKRPCKALRTLRTYNKALKKVRQRRIPGDVPGLGSFRSQLRSDMLRVNVALLQLPRAKKCGGGKPSKVTSVDAKVLSSNAKQLHLQVQLPSPKFVGQQVGGTAYQQMLMDGMGETGDVGKPAIPTSTKFFGVPLGADVDVQVNSTQGYDLPGVDLYPHQPSSVDAPIAPVAGAPDESAFLNPPFEINRKTYRSSRKFPAKQADGSALGMMRDLRIGGVDVAGGQYKPSTGKLHVFTAIDVTVKFKGKNSGKFGDSTDFNNTWDTYFTRNYQAVVTNFDAVKGNLNAGARAQLCGEDMLVVTSPALEQAAQTFATARRNAGLNPRVVTTGAGAGHAGTTNTQIQAFIRGELNSTNCLIHPSYVVLLGNTANVPTFIGPCTSGGNQAQCDVASDLPYSLNGNGNDLFADVELGRIPATNLSSANAVVSKIVNYENTMPAPARDDFYKHATVTGYFQPQKVCVLNNGKSGTPNCDPAAGAVNGHLQIVYANHQDTRGFTKTSDSVLRSMKSYGYKVDRLWTTDNSNVIPERYYDGTPIPNNLQRPAFAWDANTTDFLNAYNEGRFLVFHRDHGWTDGWSNPDLSSGNVSSLNNGTKLPVVFGVDCQSSQFDLPGNPSFVEEQIEKPSGGAVAGFGDTRVSPSFPNNHMALGFFDALFPNLIPDFGSSTATRKLGDVLLSGKAYMATQNGLDGQDSGDTYFEHHLYHLLGDPSMQMWAATPVNFDINKILSQYRAIAPVNPGDPVFQVNVSFPQAAGDPPAPGTVATLFSGDQAVGRGIVGADGKVTITPDSNVQPQNLRVAFDQEGVLPASDTVDAAPQAQKSTMSLKCPNGARAGSFVSASGTLTPVPGGATVKLHYTGPNNQVVDDTVQTNASGNWTRRTQIPSAGQWTLKATFEGDTTYAPSSASCNFTMS